MRSGNKLTSGPRPPCDSVVWTHSEQNSVDAATQGSGQEITLCFALFSRTCGQESGPVPIAAQGEACNSTTPRGEALTLPERRQKCPLCVCADRIFGLNVR